MVAKNDFTPASLLYIISGVTMLVGGIFNFWHDDTKVPTVTVSAIISLCVLFICQNILEGNISTDIESAVHRVCITAQGYAKIAVIPWVRALVLRVVIFKPGEG